MGTDFFDSDGGQGYVKAGFLGFTAGGKTFTAVELAIGIRHHFGLPGSIAFFDTENGAGFVKPKVEKRTGRPMLVKRSRSFNDLMTFARACEDMDVSVAIVDSMTHVWRELCDAYLDKVNEKRSPDRRRFNLEFQDWGPIKSKWATWTDWYLNSKMHVVICGRAGWEYNEEEDERGKKKLVKTGTKMKVENEFGFEPGLLIEMERETTEGKLVNRATVLKDRWDLMNGESCDNPTFDFFKPHVAMFSPDAHRAVDTSVKTDLPIEEQGLDPWRKELRERQIACEEIQGELLRRWPGQTAVEKASKMDSLEKFFGTRSWTAVENFPSIRLREGLERLKAEPNPVR